MALVEYLPFPSYRWTFGVRLDGMNQHTILRSLAWTATVTTIFVLTIGAVLIAMVTGFWVYDQTAIKALGWIVGIAVMLGFLATIGVSIGTWLWFKGPVLGTEDSLDQILEDMTERVDDE